MTPRGFVELDRIRSRAASTACPDCGDRRTQVSEVYVGIPDLSPISGTIGQVYECFACWFRAFDGDALRADGVNTDAQVAESIRRSARNYTHAARVLTGVEVKP